MSRAFQVGLVLPIGAAVVLCLWWADAKRDAVSPTPSEQVVEAPAPGEGVLAEAAASVSEPAPSAESADLADASRPSSSRAPLAPGSPRISGRVVVSNGSLEQIDATVGAEIHLDGGGVLDSGVSARMERDGSFTLTVLPETKSATLTLESSLLHAEAVQALPSQRDVVLSARLYAALEGEVVPVSPSDPWEMTVTATVSTVDVERLVGERDPLVLSLSDTKFGQQFRVLPKNGAFRLGPLPVGVRLVLRVENSDGPDWIEVLEPLAPGEVREVRAELEPGTRIEGRVVDEHGQPVSGASVSSKSATPVAMDLTFPGDDWKSSATTDASGRFVITKRGGGRWKVVVEEHGLARGAEALVDTRAGDVRDLTFTVVRGSCLEGTVVFDDGRSVPSFQVWASGTEGHGFTGGRDGRFRLCGLVEGEYRLDVRAKDSGVSGSTSLTGVRPSGAPIEIVLAEAKSFPLLGVVVDERGAPVAGASIFAGVEVTRGNEDGTFVLSGLAEGKWLLLVNAPGHFSLEQVVETGADVAPLRLVLALAGKIQGRVLDETGTGVANAWVGPEKEAHAAQFFGPQFSATDADGRFSIDASASSTRLLAMRAGYAPSPVVEIELSSGEVRDDVVLRLGASCRVTGRVLDAKGNPLRAARLALPRLPFRTKGMEADENGAFAIDDLPAGELELLAMPAGNNEEGACASAKVDLVPGIPAEVELRLSTPDPVRVRGRVTRDGAPIACWITARSRGFWNKGTSGADGRFELELQQPGEWIGLLGFLEQPSPSSDPFSGDVRRFEFHASKGEEAELVLAFESLPRAKSLADLCR